MQSPSTFTASRDSTGNFYVLFHSVAALTLLQWADAGWNAYPPVSVPDAPAGAGIVTRDFWVVDAAGVPLIGYGTWDETPPGLYPHWGYVLKWDGAAWQSLGSGVGNDAGYLYAMYGLTLDGQGRPVALGGYGLNTLGFVWNGTDWTFLPDRPTIAAGGVVYDHQGRISVLASDDAGSRVLRLDDGGWAAITGLLDPQFYRPDLHFSSNDEPVIGLASFPLDGGALPEVTVAHWTDGGWSFVLDRAPLAPYDSMSLDLDSNDRLLGGWSSLIDGGPYASVWQPDSVSCP
ncbi:MAG: hypothetical protein QM723_33700 [Myxococcaceae bacterium]